MTIKIRRILSSSIIAMLPSCNLIAADLEQMHHYLSTQNQNTSGMANSSSNPQALPYQNGYNTPSQPNQSYQRYSGQKYRYDLNNPTDSLRYSTDVNAQLRDSINPNIPLDRGMGQYGGGSY